MSKRSWIIIAIVFVVVYLYFKYGIRLLEKLSEVEGTGEEEKIEPKDVPKEPENDAPTKTYTVFQLDNLIPNNFEPSNSYWYKGAQAIGKIPATGTPISAEMIKDKLKVYLTSIGAKQGDYVQIGKDYTNKDYLLSSVIPKLQKVPSASEYASFDIFDGKPRLIAFIAKKLGLKVGDAVKIDF